MLEDVKEDQKGDCCTPILTECVVLSSCTSSGFKGGGQTLQTLEPN